MTKTRTMKTIIVSFLLFAMLLCGFANIGTMTAFAADGEETTTTETKSIMLGTSHITGGQASNVYFGNYYQSDANGQTKDPIKWRVLSNAEGKLFLLSDQNLDVFKYHTEYEAVTWETSTMRSWLNGLAYNKGNAENAIDYANDNFLDTAFSAKEQAAIADTEVVNDDNPDYQTEGGNNTTDKVFLLSIAEAMNTSYFAYENSRIATTTAYVADGGKIGTIGMYGVGAANFWWLRSPGSNSNYAAYVIDNGYFYVGGYFVINSFNAVRPAFNLNLNSVLFTSAAKGGKPTGGLTATTAYTGNEYKLTLLDSNRDFAVSETGIAACTSSNFSLTYSNATTGTNEYISAMIVDENGAVVYYGQLAQAASASGTVSLTVPADIAEGNYTLKLFNEQINGDYKTDYSSAFVDVSLTVHQSDYNNGSCTVCGEYEPATLNGDTESAYNGYYEIGNVGQLMWFAELVNGGNKTANAVLTDDIDMNGIDWTTICSTGLYYGTTTYTDNGYEGTFDGGGYTISNLKITGTDGVKASYGLFGTLSGTVKNLGMSGMTFSYSGTYNVDTTDARAGAIAGQMLDGSLISDCFVVDSALTPNNYIVGGIAGCNYAGTIQNCYTKNVTISAHDRCGNLVADTRGDSSTTDRPGTVKNCYTDASRVVGTNTSGSEYITGCVTNIPDSIFASGRITYQLNGGSSDGLWKLNASGQPAFEGETVYQNTCGGDIFYSTTDGDFDSHVLNTENVLCTNCKSYVPATLVTAENYSSLGLDESYVGYYAIKDASNLYWYSERERIGDISGSIVLLNNIILDDSEAEWVPIVWDGDCTFDGRGNTITLKLDCGTTQRTENYGLFGTCNYSVVKNLVLDGDLTVNTTGHVGAVAGSMYRTIVSGVISTANVTNTCTTSGSVGGLAGCFGGQHDPDRNQYSKIENSAVYANVTGYNAGGLVGEGWGGNQYWDITNAAYFGDVTTTNTTDGTAGAIVGYQATDNYTSTFTNIYWYEEHGIDFYGKRDTENQVYTNTEAKNAAQFTTGEVAYLLGSAWGQTLGGTDTYPVPGGDTVYQVKNCKDETAYSNTNENIGHIYAGGICTVCGAVCAHSYGANGFCTACDGYQPAVDSDSDGYYEIDNAGKLYWFAQQVNSGNNAINAVLTENITVNQNLLSSLTYDGNGNVTNGDSFRVWIRIGTDPSKYYAGTFDGNNKTVSGLYFNDSDTDYVGMFGSVGRNGTVKNVGVIDSYLNGGGNVGGVVGWNDGTVRSCYNSGTVSGGDLSFVGGVVGYNYFTVENCYNTGAVSGSSSVGGAVGTNSGTVRNCYNSGAVSGSDQTYVGGVVGENYDTIQNCYNTGTLSGRSYVGGVVGENYDTIQNCYNTGTLSGRSYVGGVVGHNYSDTVENCYYLSDTAAGGIEGGDVTGSAEGKTAAQFASGEVAYLLQAGQTAGEDGKIPQVWYQTVGTDPSPQVHRQYRLWGREL